MKIQINNIRDCVQLFERQGFTLIELLLGIVIFSILSLSLYSSLWSGIEVQSRSQNVNQIYREARWTLDKIAKDIENMTVYQYGDAQGNKTSLFSGGPDELNLAGLSSTGIKVIKYSLQEPPHGSIKKVIIGDRSSKQPSAIVANYRQEQHSFQIVREERPFAANDPFLSESQEEVDVLSIHLKQGGLTFYYGYLDKKDEKSMQINWKENTEDDLPAAIRVKMVFSSADEKSEAVEFTKDIFIPIVFAKKGS